MQLLHTVAAGGTSPGRSSAVRCALRHVLLIVAAVAIVAVAARLLENQLPPTAAALVLILFAAVGGAAAALLAALAARLTADHRVAWLSMALGCYSLLAIPTMVIDTLGIASVRSVGAALFLVHSAVVALLLVALIAAAPLAGFRVMHAALGGAALIAAAGTLGFAVPATLQAIIMPQPLRFAVALAWCCLAVAIAILAVMRQAWALWQVSAGLTMLGIAHAGRSTDASPTADLGLAFSSIHLLAVGLVLWGTLHLAREALDRLADEQAAHEEELRLAEIRLARTAERDHELRNGLAGLAGATSLMSAYRGDPVLTTAVASELDRLDELLRASGDHGRSSRSSTFSVAPVLQGIVALREATGMDIRLESEPGLLAIGSSSMLAQVVTNLIANAARHAPGSPVRLSALRDGDEILIRVRDFGPGVPPGREHAVFERFVRDERAGGTGLGLHICRRLLEDAAGSIDVRPSTPGQVGCTVVARLPAAQACAPASRSILPEGAWCRAS